MSEHDPLPDRGDGSADVADHARRFAWICDGCVLVTRTSHNPSVSDLVDAWPLDGPDDCASVDGELVRHRFRRVGAWARVRLGPSLAGCEHEYPQAVVVEIDDEDDPGVTFNDEGEPDVLPDDDQPPAATRA